VEIKALEVKSLREKTGAGMMECKRALVEANGDPAKAEKILKELGLAAVKKVDGRVTKEGRIFSKLVQKKGILLELNCETDFVARNKDFIATGEKMIATALEKNITSVTVGKPELIDNPKVKETAFNLALHVAAFAPSYLATEKVDPAYIKEQEEIFTKQAQNTGKPENVLQGIIKGKLSKHLSEICFLEQNYVKEEKFKVKDILKNLGKELGSTIDVTDYAYMKLGA
jgi:elongation factor Ts